MTVLTSSVHLGQAMSRHGLQRIPEENAPPAELARVVELESESAPEPRMAALVIDPRLNALHVALLGQPRRFNDALSDYRHELGERLLADGPSGLDAGEQVALLADPGQMRALHSALWRLPTWPDWAAEVLRPDTRATAPV